MLEVCNLTTGKATLLNQVAAVGVAELKLFAQVCMKGGPGCF
ncbi:hypothetical protein [Cyanobium sp. WKJ7-Wakatipu]|nr:hypothetical protein [Cyanobium sp. WKJ7-Wakatipu]